MRIGYFGGTFDPPPRGHLIAARAGAEAFPLDTGWLAPTGTQPLNKSGPDAEYVDRLAMTRLLCRADSRLEVSEIDAPHADGSANYTIEAIAALREQFPEAEIFCIVGADSFLGLRQWRDSDTLLQQAEWIVVSRPEFDLDGISALHFTPAQRERIHLLTTLEDDTSASGIRERLRVGVSPGDRLTPEVMLYIARLHLYHPER